MNKPLRIVCFLFLILICVSAARGQDSLTLDQAVQLALKQNPALAAAADEADAAKARVAQVRAGWFPRLDASQGFTRGNNPVYVFGTLLTQRHFTAANFALPLLNAPAPLDNFQTRFDGQVSLFDSGRTLMRQRGAERLKTAADYETEQARQDLILRVVRAYYDVLVAREDLVAAQEALKTAESSAGRARSLEQAGLVVSSDRLSADVFRAQMKDREIRAANALELARLALSRELGLAPGTLREPSGSLAEPAAPATTPEEWERIALAERPALRAVELQQQASDANRKLAKAEFGPRLGLFADFERDAETLGGPSGTNWAAGARLDLNLFAGGADHARVAEAEARSREAGHQLEWFRSGVQLEVRQAYLETVAAAQRAAAARDSVEQARESLRILQNRYQAGLITITELLRAETAQLEARTGYLAALHDWQVARAQLERAAGRLTANSELLRGGQSQ
jgi:outer membrane protein TolC